MVATLLAAMSTAAAPCVVEFPGPVRSALAPGGSGERFFYRPHMIDGGQESPVFYDDGRGHVRQVATLTRTMGVGWSPDGRRAFLQDNWGSDIADCHVLTRTPGGIAGVSLLRLAQRTPGHPTGNERPSRSHFYVHCDRWRSSGRVTGAVSGHTDTNPMHDFNHPFTYDARAHRITWRR